MREPGGILDFFVKTLVVMGMALLVLAISFRVLEQRVFNQARSIEQSFISGVNVVNSGLEQVREGVRKVGMIQDGIGFREFAGVLDRQIKSAGAWDISPEKQKELISNIRILVRRYKPMLDEFAPLFSGDSSRLKN